MVANPEDRFSCDEAHMIFKISMTMSLTKEYNGVEHSSNIFQNVTLICVMVKATDVTHKF